MPICCCSVSLGSSEITVRLGPKSRVVAGEPIALRVDMSRAVLFEPQTERRLA